MPGETTRSSTPDESAVSVLDASALIAFVAGEPGAEVVEAALRDVATPAAISSVNLAESVDTLVRRLGIGESEVAHAIDLLELGGLEIVPLDGRSAYRAGRFRATHYRKGTTEISIADAVAAVLAADRGAALLTNDRALGEAAEAVGVAVGYVAIRDTGEGVAGT